VTAALKRILWRMSEDSGRRKGIIYNERSVA
jgi:hypothetical protein